MSNQSDYPYSGEEDAANEKRRRMREENRRALQIKRQQQVKRIKYGIIGGGALIVIFLIVLILGLRKKTPDSSLTPPSSLNPTSVPVAESASIAGDSPDEPLYGDSTLTEELSSQNPDFSDGEEVPAQEASALPEITIAGENVLYSASPSPNMKTVGEDVYSTYAIVIDVDNAQVVASRDGYTRINPASMTKILTLLIACEHITDLSETVTITEDITNYCYRHGCSVVGFDTDEVVTVEDLLYGTILPSGADAALALANYVAGSQEAFVELMNQKLERLGLSSTTHFTNCVGIYDENHYSTAYDIALLLQYALDNELCRQILGTRIYTTTKSETHPDGLEISNWFIRRIEDKDTGCKVIAAKTGFVNESGCCGASCGEDENGKRYICVTADAWSSWRCIYDHVALYNYFY